MGGLKGFFEDVAVVRDKTRPLADWASRSSSRSLIVLCVVIIGLFSAYYIFIQGLLHVVFEDIESRRQQMQFKGEELQYQAALSSIELCINATQKKPELRRWYCKHATMMFKQSSPRWPQERVDEIIALRAYDAMKSDVAGYLRGIELSRLTHAGPTREQKLLSFLTSKEGSTGVLLALFSVFVGGMYVLRWRTRPPAVAQ